MFVYKQTIATGKGCDGVLFNSDIAGVDAVWEKPTFLRIGGKINDIQYLPESA